MKVVLFSVLALHGIIHFSGFLKAWGLAPVSGMNNPPGVSTTGLHLLGALWLAAGLLFLAAVVSAVASREWWWMPASAGLVVSQLLIIFYWQDAKWGTVANIIALAAVIIGFASWNFNRTVASEVSNLIQNEATATSEIVTEDMLKPLPPPVQRWLHRSGVVGKEKAYFVRLKQKGLMRMKPEDEKWAEARAEQYFSINHPAFIWQVNMKMMSFMPVEGRDKSVDGKAEIDIRLFSLFSVVNQSDEKIAQGAMQRWLSEICWFPSAALSPYITWEELDGHSAKATIRYKEVSGSVVFHFNNEGDLAGCSADRFMGGGKDANLEKWVVRTTRHGVLDGIRIPVSAEATWKLKSGDFTWYKLEITELEYNKAELYSN